MKLHMLKAELERGEEELLSGALVRWTDLDGFSDEQVARVKAVFRRVFQMPSSTALVGSAFPDGIMLQEAGNNRVFYALLSGTGEWDAAKLDCGEGQSMAWSPGIKIRHVLALMAQSEEIGLTVILNGQQADNL